MKPDGVATTPAEPAVDVVEPVPEVAANEEQVQQDSSPSSSQLEKLENEGEQDGATLALPLPGKEVNGKCSKPAVKTKAPIKTKPSTAGTKATTTTGAASRPATAQSRVANGFTKPVSNGASKKPEMKKSAPVGVSSQVKKAPSITTVAPRAQVKTAERKAVGSARPAPSTSSGARKATAATSQALNSKPVPGGNNAAVKPKTTAPRPTAAPAAKASVSAASKATTIPKTTRPTVATSRPTTSSTSVRPTTTASKSTALRTTVSAPSGANSASAQPSKPSSTVAAKKEIKTTTSAAARKPLTTTTTFSTATKATKPAAAAKRLPTDTRTSQQKMDKVQVPTRKVPPSPRNISSRTASGRMATEFSNNKQVVSSNPVSVKCQPAKPTQSVLPLVIKGKHSEEQSPEPVGPSAVIETTAAIAAVESLMEAHVPSVELAHTDQQTSALVEGQGEGVQVPAPEPTNEDTTTETIDAEPLAIQSVANVPVFETSNPPTVVQESETVLDNILDVAHEMNEQEHVTASPCEVPVTSQVPPKGLEVVEKQEQIIGNFEEEEEREGSQQVSVSDMSGTQPTEESRPGSAGLAGSLWRAGGLPSEFDSEDVSCSQQGASELSAPGVLEGTESMDDIGEASLKGADGEGASAGSPDFEKFPDILANEDDDEDDYDDHVDDMEVGSEMTEDPHRQCNDNEDEDDDVEMASEGVTESGLESYGNADEDDFAEDYRLDNLNRMQPPSIVPALSSPNPFADAWIQSLQPDPILVSGPPSNPWQTYSELPNQPAAQSCLDIGSTKTDPSSPPVVMDPVPTLSSSEPAAELIVCLKPDLASHSQLVSQSSTLPDVELAIHIPSGASTPEELKDYSISPGLENEKQPLPVSPIPIALPDIMQDLYICKSDHAESEHEDEEPETMPADMLAGLSNVVTTAPSSHSSATGDEASDTEGDMQISDPTEPGSTGNECFDGMQVAHSMSALVEESEETCAEMDGGGGGGGGGSDTPQSATSAASYGFECTTSNSNAQSMTESCIKSPGIFSLENEEQLPDEAKDPSLIKDLNLAPAGAPADTDLLDQQEECQMNSGQQVTVKVSEELPETGPVRGTVPIETGLDSSSSSEHQQDMDLDAPHSYYSTICEKTDSFLTGSDICVQPREKVPTVSTRTPKPHYGLRVDHVTRLPNDLPPRMPNVGCNAQLRRLEQHQLQLEEIEQRREQQSQNIERRIEERGVEKSDERNNVRDVEREVEQKSRMEKERELEEQKSELLHLQIQQQQQELKQRQQIMQWQQELEQQKQQSKHQKNLSAVLLSPSGLCTIYEALETSDAEEDFEDETEEKEMVLKFKVEHECSPKERSSILEADSCSDNPDSPRSQSTLSNPIQDHEGLTRSVILDSPPLSGTSSAQHLSPLELDWGKKADIVQQLINQTLLLNGDNCSPLLLLPGGGAGTLSPLETSLWPNLPPLTPTSATVTSVSSYSAELSGSSPKGEWTVVELETHH